MLSDIPQIGFSREASLGRECELRPANHVRDRADPSRAQEKYKCSGLKLGRLSGTGDRSHQGALT